MGLGFLIGAGVSLVLLASAADGILWKYTAEREQLRRRAAGAEAQVAELAAEVRELRAENRALSGQPWCSDGRPQLLLLAGQPATEPDAPPRPDLSCVPEDGSADDAAAPRWTR
jgi:hypothetical protein